MNHANSKIDSGQMFRGACVVASISQVAYWSFRSGAPAYFLLLMPILGAVAVVDVPLIYVQRRRQAPDGLGALAWAFYVTGAANFMLPLFPLGVLVRVAGLLSRRYHPLLALVAGLTVGYIPFGLECSYNGPSGAGWICADVARYPILLIPGALALLAGIAWVRRFVVPEKRAEVPVEEDTAREARERAEIAKMFRR